MENYLNSQNKSLTDHWNFGTSSTFDADTLLGAIFNKGGNLCVLYTDPDIIYAMNDLWSKKWKTAFDKWLEAYNEEYNPIHNYNMTETTNYDKETIGLSTSQLSASSLVANDVSRTITGSETTSDNQDITEDVDKSGSNSGTDGNTQTVNRNDYDTGVLKMHEQTVDAGNHSNTSTESKDTSATIDRDISTATSNTERTDNDTSSSSSQNGRDTSNVNEGFEQTLIRTGNIGVTTSQQMLESEMELRKKYNIYNMMADMFIKEMAIGLYY